MLGAAGKTQPSATHRVLECNTYLKGDVCSAAPSIAWQCG